MLKRQGYGQLDVNELTLRPLGALLSLSHPPPTTGSGLITEILTYSVLVLSPIEGQKSHLQFYFP